jgi:tetratricopeptide (TPR) repeat protein
MRFRPYPVRGYSFGPILIGLSQRYKKMVAAEIPTALTIRRTITIPKAVRHREISLTISQFILEQTSQLDFEKAKQFFADGMRLLQANNLEEAETQLTRSLEIIPDRVSTLNNLSAVKSRRLKFAEAEDLAQKAIAAGDHSPEAWSNLGIARAGANRHEEAVQAFDRALYYDSSYTMGWFNKAASFYRLKKYDEALEACDEALKLDSTQYLIYFTKSLVLKELGQMEEAEKNYFRSIKMRADLSPVVIAERRPTQKAEVLIISHNLSKDTLFKSFEVLHYECPNFPGQLAELFQDDYHFNYVLEGIATRPHARDKIPQPDVIINNCANGELVLSEGKLPGLSALMDSFNVPVVNHPSRVVQTTRDMSARLLQNVSGLLVPTSMRFSVAGKTPQELMREIERHYHYPIIARTLTTQQGKGMYKIDSREALLKVLASDLREDFFVIQFMNTPDKHGFYRKIRGTILKDEIIISRVDFSDHWNVRGRRTEVRLKFYLANMYLLDEEKRICQDPEATLGRSAIQALQTIRDRIPLDICGIDFDVDANGTLIFYEANATMNLLTTAQKEIPNPPEPEERLREAFRRYFKSLLGGR